MCASHSQLTLPPPGRVRRKWLSAHTIAPNASHRCSDLSFSSAVHDAGTTGCALSTSNACSPPPTRVTPARVTSARVPPAPRVPHARRSRASRWCMQVDASCYLQVAACRYTQVAPPRPGEPCRCRCSVAAPDEFRGGVRAGAEDKVVVACGASGTRTARSSDGQGKRWGGEGRGRTTDLGPLSGAHFGFAKLPEEGDHAPCECHLPTPHILHHKPNRKL